MLLGAIFSRASVHRNVWLLHACSVDDSDAFQANLKVFQFPFIVDFLLLRICVGNVMCGWLYAARTEASVFTDCTHRLWFRMLILYGVRFLALQISPRKMYTVAFAMQSEEEKDQ